MRLPGGQFWVSEPQSSDSRCPPKFATQTLSSPSTVIPQGLVRPAPWIFFGPDLTPGLIRVTSPPPFGSLSETAFAVRTPVQGATTHLEFETQA